LQQIRPYSQNQRKRKLSIILRENRICSSQYAIIASHRCSIGKPERDVR